MRIALFIASLGTGGAERVTSIMANHWVEQGHDVHIVTLDWGDAEPAYQLDERVRLETFGRAGSSSGLLEKVKSNFHRLAGIRAALRTIQPDVVISHVDTTNILVALACLGTGLKPYLVEHIHPPMHDIGPGWDMLRRLSYRLARKVVVLTEATRQFFLPTLKDRVVVIPNPVIKGDEARLGEVDSPFTHTLLSVGRLARQKGVDVLFEAFARLAPDYPEWGVVVLGEGPERGTLEKQARQLGISEVVHMPGVVENPFRAYEADIFVMPSRYEGFPMALCEAMAAGLPVVASDCPTGPADIVRPGVDGILVPPEDVEKLAGALSNLMDDASLRSEYASNVGEVAERYGVEQVMALWERLIRDDSFPQRRGKDGSI